MQMQSVILDTVKEEWKKAPPVIRNGSLSDKELASIGKELSKKSDIDTLQLCKESWQRFSGGEKHSIKESDHGKIFSIFYPGISDADIPHELWMRILRIFGGTGNAQPTVVFCAHPTRRMFPRSSKKIGPSEINGGYTHLCSCLESCSEKRLIVIYRAEDATRVLIHELLHFYCTDRRELDIDYLEAETEAWAELLYCAFLSMGDSKDFLRRVRTQANYMKVQNGRILDENHIIRGSRDFPWRYTIGKQEVWERWGLIDRYKHISTLTSIESLRLTREPSEYTMRLFGVSQKSTIL